MKPKTETELNVEQAVPFFEYRISKSLSAIMSTASASR